MFKKMQKKGFAIGDLVPIGITFVVVAIALSFGATILTNLSATQSAGSVAANSTTNGLLSLQTFTSWLPSLALVIVAAIVIGILVTYLGGARKK